MIDVLLTRLRLGRQTIAYPDGPVRLPDRFRGRPALDATRCPASCDTCAGVCPTDAVHPGPGALRIDTGACLFCGACAEACPEGAIRFTFRRSCSSA